MFYYIFAPVFGNFTHLFSELKRGYKWLVHTYFKSTDIVYYSGPPGVSLHYILINTCAVPTCHHSSALYIAHLHTVWRSGYRYVCKLGVFSGLIQVFCVNYDTWEWSLSFFILTAYFVMKGILWMGKTWQCGTVPTFPPIEHRVCSITFFDLCCLYCDTVHNVGLHNHKSLIAISTNGTRN